MQVTDIRITRPQETNIDDGFYLQSGTDGKPLFEVIINFKEMVGMPFIPDELEKGATEFYE